MLEAEPTLLGSGAASSTDAGANRTSPTARRPEAPTVYVAGFWRRAVAMVVDAAIFLPVAALLTAVVASIASIRLPPGRPSQPDFWLDLLLASDPVVVTAVAIGLAVASLYLFVFQATLGQTLGMRALGVRVIDVYGQPPSFVRSGLRTLGYLAGWATLFLGFFWIGFDAEKRGLHDWIAGTYVVHNT